MRIVSGEAAALPVHVRRRGAGAGWGIEKHPIVIVVGHVEIAAAVQGDCNRTV